MNYDLSLGNVIRFLNEEIKIIKADNQGIYYSRMKEPEVKDYSLFTQAQIEELLQKDRELNAKSISTKVVDNTDIEKSVNDVNNEINQDSNKDTDTKDIKNTK